MFYRLCQNPVWRTLHSNDRKAPGVYTFTHPRAFPMVACVKFYLLEKMIYWATTTDWPWEYPVSRENTLWSQVPMGRALMTGAKMEVNTRLLSLGALSCCLPRIIPDTKERSQESWTVTPVKTRLYDHNAVNTFNQSQWDSSCERYSTVWTKKGNQPGKDWRHKHPVIPLNFSPSYFRKCW